MRTQPQSNEPQNSGEKATLTAFNKLLESINYYKQLRDLPVTAKSHPFVRTVPLRELGAIRDNIDKVIIAVQTWPLSAQQNKTVMSALEDIPLDIDKSELFRYRGIHGFKPTAVHETKTAAKPKKSALTKIVTKAQQAQAANDSALIKILTDERNNFSEFLDSVEMVLRNQNNPLLKSADATLADAKLCFTEMLQFVKNARNPTKPLREMNWDELSSHEEAIKKIAQPFLEFVAFAGDLLKAFDTITESEKVNAIKKAINDRFKAISEDYDSTKDEFYLLYKHLEKLHAATLTDTAQTPTAFSQALKGVLDKHLSQFQQAQEQYTPPEERLEFADYLKTAGSMMLSAKNDAKKNAIGEVREPKIKLFQHFIDDIIFNAELRMLTKIDGWENFTTSTRGDLQPFLDYMNLAAEASQIFAQAATRDKELLDVTIAQGYVAMAEKLDAANREPDETFMMNVESEFSKLYTYLHQQTIAIKAKSASNSFKQDMEKLLEKFAVQAGQYTEVNSPSSSDSSRSQMDSSSPSSSSP